MKKLLTALSFLLIATASHAQVQSLNSDVRKINDYKHKPGGYQGLITDYKKTPDTQAQSIERYVQIQEDYQQAQANNGQDLNNSESEVFIVERVIDGDTIELTNGKRVQLIGIDTPETVHPSKPVEYFGKEASAFTKRMCEGKVVRLEYDQRRRDRYDRLLAYVYLEDGTFVNEEIVKQGYGHASTEFPFKYLKKFKRYERKARKNKMGLWKEEELQEELGFCANDLKGCPDGSYVGRVGPNCEFKACPEPE